MSDVLITRTNPSLAKNLKTQAFTTQQYTNITMQSNLYNRSDHNHNINLNIIGPWDLYFIYSLDLPKITPKYQTELRNNIACADQTEFGISVNMIS